MDLEALKASIRHCLVSDGASFNEIADEYFRRVPPYDRTPSDPTLVQVIEGNFADFIEVNPERDGILLKQPVEHETARHLRQRRWVDSDDRVTVLEALSIGRGFAEGQDDAGFAYFRSKEWMAFFRDDRDIFVGPKGCGKSQMLLHALGQGKNELPQETKILPIDPTRLRHELPGPSALQELGVEGHEALWCIIFALVTYEWVKAEKFTLDTSRIEASLNEMGVLSLDEIESRRVRLASRLTSAAKALRFTGSISLTGVGSVNLQKPDKDDIENATKLKEAQRESLRFISAVAEDVGKVLWFTIDRTDTLYSQNRILEIDSLHALAHLIRDNVGQIEGNQRFKIKLFMKSSTWGALSNREIAEFSHILDRYISFNWRLLDLYRVLIGRFCANQAFVDHIEYNPEAATGRDRQGFEDFMAQLLPSREVRSYGGLKGPIEAIVSALREGLGSITPRDFIKTFRAIAAAEADFLSNNPTNKPLRHIFQQQSLENGLKSYALESLSALRGEDSAVSDIERYVRRNADRTFTKDTLAEILKKDGSNARSIDDSIERLLRLGVVRLDDLGRAYELPRFFFDALVPIERRKPVDGSKASPSEGQPANRTSSSATISGFIRLRFGREEGRVVIKWNDRRVALPAHVFKVVLDHYHAAKTADSFEFIVWAIYQSSWIIEMSNPYFPGVIMKSTVVDGDDDSDFRCEVDLGFSNGMIVLPIAGELELEAGQEVEVSISEDASQSGQWLATCHS